MADPNRAGAGSVERRPGRRPTPAVLAAPALVLVLVLGACNTVSGVGQDIGAAGRAISDTAEETKEAL